MRVVVRGVGALLRWIVCNSVGKDTSGCLGFSVIRRKGF